MHLPAVNQLSRGADTDVSCHSLSLSFFGVLLAVVVTVINPLGLIAANGTVNTRPLRKRTFKQYWRWMAAGCHKWADSKICLCMADKKPAGAVYSMNLISRG
jgi:hypothetical protein